MTTKVSIKGYVAAATEKEIILTSLDPTVERNIAKDLLYVPYPSDSETTSGFGYDIGFDEDLFTISANLVNIIYDSSANPYTPAETLYYLTYLAKVGQQSNDVTFYYDGSTYNVLVKQMSYAQQASWGKKHTLRMILQVID